MMNATCEIGWESAYRTDQSETLRVVGRRVLSVIDHAAASDTERRPTFILLEAHELPV